METVIVTTRGDAEELLDQIVSRILSEKLPGLIRRATAKQWLTRDEVLDLLDISVRQLQYLRERRKIVFSQRGRSIVYCADSVFRYLDEGKVAPRSFAEGIAQ